MAANSSTFPATLPRTARTPVVVATPVNPTDIARFIDLLLNYMTFDQRVHSADIMELQALSTTIKASSNNA
jgi:hypothetical protein